MPSGVYKFIRKPKNPYFNNTTGKSCCQEAAIQTKTTTHNFGVRLSRKKEYNTQYWDLQASIFLHSYYINLIVHLNGSYMMFMIFKFPSQEGAIISGKVSCSKAKGSRGVEVVDTGPWTRCIVIVW